MPDIQIMGVNLTADVSIVPMFKPGTTVTDGGRVYMYAQRLSTSAHTISVTCSLSTDGVTYQMKRDDTPGGNHVYMVIAPDILSSGVTKWAWYKEVATTTLLTITNYKASVTVSTSTVKPVVQGPLVIAG